MRIKCPYCGERDVSEFLYLGAADLERPDPQSAGAAEAFYEYVYLRENPVGPYAELWYHSAGCHGWLRVVRDTRTHIMQSADYATPPHGGAK
jgi:sarcosine oxidase subunit delta